MKSLSKLLWHLAKLLMLLLFFGLFANSNADVICGDNEIFNNGEWVVKAETATIPESPFNVSVNGNFCSKTTKVLTFYRRVDSTFPQVFVIYSSGYLRIKAGADPYHRYLLDRALC